MTVTRALALLVLVAPSIAAGGWRCEAKGGRAWREVRTEHFQIATDLPSRKARELAVELETMHAAVRTGLFPKPPPMPGVIRVIAFRDEDEYREFAPKRADAYYEPRLDGLPTVVMHGYSAEYTRVVLAHELTHHMLARVFPRQPRWFSEGYACYMETVGADGPYSTPAVGGVPPHRLNGLHVSAERLSNLLQLQGRMPDVEAYNLAWALVHFLIQTHGAEFDGFQVRLARGASPEAAWREVFPGWDPRVPEHMSALRDELTGYLNHGRFGYSDLRLEKDRRSTERPLPSADMHGLRLLLPRRAPGTSEEFAEAQGADAEEALAEDPGQVTALRWMANARGGDRRALSQRAVALHPENHRAWLFRADAIEEAEEREQAYRKALELAPEDPFPLNALAWFLVESEREGEALPLARKAAALAPWDPAVLDTYAAALAGLGQCKDALWLQRRAVDALPEHLSADARKGFVDRLAELEARCAANGSATGLDATGPPRR